MEGNDLERFEWEVASAPLNIIGIDVHSRDMGIPITDKIACEPATTATPIQNGERYLNPILPARIGRGKLLE